MQSTSQTQHQMNQLGTVYATKRRRRNGKSMKPPPKDGVTKSNPSKRHRERLNAELDTLASLLPFEQNILSKLDRLSILRLAVSYLRTKSYFQVSMHRLNNNEQQQRSELLTYDHSLIDGELFLQALNGFLLILTCEGEVFFATHSIESYLGFHQSDIVHQSVYELVHSEDREELQRQLTWNSFLPAELSNATINETLHNPEQIGFLERSFTVRFRCLLDNTSGFLRLDIRGRVKLLHGQNRKSEEPPLALFALCTPFGPPSLLEVPQKEVMFKSKHKLDLSLVSMDQRGKMLIGYSDSELSSLGGYDLIHFDDLAYFASAHQELLKTGASGLIAYRLQTKDSNWQWLQTSSRLVYKNSKPDFIISTHRPLMEEEGRDLLGKRTMDFKVSYLDAGLTNSYFSDVSQSNTVDQSPTTTTTTASNSSSSTPASTKQNGQHHRRYKTQLRDFLTTVRPTKRAIKSANNNNPTNHHHHHHNHHTNNIAIPPPPNSANSVDPDGSSSQYIYAPQPHVVHHPHIQNPIIQPNYNYNYNNEYYNYTSALDFYSFRAINYYNNDYYYNTSSEPQSRGNYDCYNPSAAAAAAAAVTSPVIGGIDPLVVNSKKLVEPSYEQRTVIMYSGKNKAGGGGGGQGPEDVKPPTWGSIVKSSLDTEQHLYGDDPQHHHQQQHQQQQSLWIYPTIGNSVNSSNSI